MLFPFSRRRLRRSSLVPGRYLTDGQGLFRVLSHFDDSRSIMVVIEDCITLETHACAARELEGMGFRSVRIAAPAPVVAPAPVAEPTQVAEPTRVAEPRTAAPSRPLPAI